MKAINSSKIVDLGDPLAFPAHALSSHLTNQGVPNHLVSLGPYVAVPASSSLPSLDVLVDGLPIQAK